ncbi:MAG: FHA domain-containing protein [Coriobacteriia bacterium]|nr:FHA domain-containing protein [Coriobacteriia bacterium]
MIETILFAGRILLVALLFLFLFTVMNTGVGLVRGQNRASRYWVLSVLKGPREVQNIKMRVTAPLVIGRAPGADLLVDAEYVSGRHARLLPMGEDLAIEDLGSTNGTLVNGQPITQISNLRDGDDVKVGDVVMRVSYR